ncbi:MAG: serine hydrolase domain-containing protein [Patescibacteria group bacterium]
MLNHLHDYLVIQSRDDKFSGSVLLAKDGKSIFEFSSGFANKERNISNGIDTKFNLGSANKMFTGVAIAQLVEAGKLGFQDFVGKYLPDYPKQVVREQVTIHHLLTHTSGLGSFIDIKFRDEFLAARSKLINITDVVNLFKNRPLSYPIGELHYSSDGYEVLGAIIESVSGKNYYEYVREHIYKIANMPDTDSYEIDPHNPRSDIAIGYTHRDPKTDRMLDDERFDNFGLNPFKGTASGSGYSTCPDLLNFTQALLTHKLLSPEMTELAITPKVKEGSKGNQTKYQGYGFQIFDIDGITRIGHPGRFAGVNTRIDMYPELGYTVIVLANYDPPAAFDVAEKATELIVMVK